MSANLNYEAVDTARVVDHGPVDRRPALIVRCMTTSDVVAALTLPRRAGVEISIHGGPAGSDATIAGTRETFAAMRPHFGSGRGLSDRGGDRVEGAVRAAYGPRFDRFREVERTYDLDNGFHLNQNIAR